MVILAYLAIAFVRASWTDMMKYRGKYTSARDSVQGFNQETPRLAVRGPDRSTDTQFGLAESLDPQHTPSAMRTTPALWGARLARVSRSNPRPHQRPRGHATAGGLGGLGKAPGRSCRRPAHRQRNVEQRGGRRHPYIYVSRGRRGWPGRATLPEKHQKVH